MRLWVNERSLVSWDISANHTMSEFLMVKKPSCCKLPNIYSMERCIRTSNYQVGCYHDKPNIEIWIIIAADFMTDIYIGFKYKCICLYMYIWYIFCFSFIMRNVYIFEWYSCRLLWHTLEMASFDQVKICRIDVPCIRLTDLQNDRRMKTIFNFGECSDFCLVTINKMFVFLFLFTVLKTCGTRQTMKSLSNTVKHDIFSVLFHRYTRYSQANWLACR